MIPEDVERELRTLVGSAYPRLDELSRVIVMLAHHADTSSNADVQQYRKEHARDIGARLAQLTTSGWLNKEGHGRGMRYSWPVAPFDLLSESDGPSGKAGKTTQENSGRARTPVETPDQVLAALAADPALTLAEVAAMIGKSTSATERAAARLVKAGRLCFVGPKKGGKWEVLK